MSAQSTTTQIIPAGGWKAAMVRLDFDSGPELHEVDLVCWKLQEDGRVDGQVVAPGSNCVIPCHTVFSETEGTDEPTDFAGYVDTWHTAEIHREWARRLYDDWRAREAADLALLDAGWQIREDRRGVHYVSPDGREMKRRGALDELGEAAA